MEENLNNLKLACFESSITPRVVGFVDEYQWSSINRRLHWSTKIEGSMVFFTPIAIFYQFSFLA